MEVLNDLAAAAETLWLDTQLASQEAPNEANLVHAIEKELETACARVGAPWAPFRLELSLKRATGEDRRLDVAHGAVIIEYEPPRSFNQGRSAAALKHARDQAEEYCDLLSVMEGRDQQEYVLVVWDGPYLSFGKWADSSYVWENIEPATIASMERLLRAIKDNGAPLVHPDLLNALVGPSSDLGRAVLPAFFEAIQRAGAPETPTTKTKLLYFEWRQLFGQAVGVQTDAMRSLLRQLGTDHAQPYDSDHAAYLFALNSYIALVAKITAALALPGASQNLLDPSVPIRQRVGELESGRLFTDAGVQNMLNGDFFSWYRDDASWSKYEELMAALVDRFRDVDFRTSRKSPESARDLFKGLYMSFAPQALRHALGEYYTPDWLAAHVVDQSEWTIDQSFLDPTCGSGTFILEALTRRLAAADPNDSAASLLDGLYGIDLNPIAVLSARASIVVALSSRISAEKPVTLPIYLADAINPVVRTGDVYEHRLITEVGVQIFRVPVAVVTRPDFSTIFQRVNDLVEAGVDGPRILLAVVSEFGLDLETGHQEILGETFETLASLHAREWNGIWATIIADRFAAGAIPAVDVIAGNPPWVKWSHLPRPYVDVIGERCRALGVFSDDTWVGGIESDISTVITYTTLAAYGGPGTKLAFLITGTVLSNESSQGFRRWRLNNLDVNLRVLSTEQFEVLRVEDFAAIAPFEGVNNHCVLLMLQRNGKPTDYPVDYEVWTPPRTLKNKPIRTFVSASSFRERATSEMLKARPVPGTDAGPWLIGTAARQDVWSHLFGDQKASYLARKGVTTDANGVFFVEVESVHGDSVAIRNDPTQGRHTGLPRLTGQRVEARHVYPLLRGAGVTAFSAIPDETHHILVPQNDKNGDPDLPTSSPRTHRFLSRFEDALRARSSYRRFQSKQAYWSLWSTGPYTFAPYKVLWREINGRSKRFAAAYASTFNDPVLGERLIIPDHKLYFVGCETQSEAAYLTGVLNAPTIAEAISSYAAQLSLGVSVVEYLLIPKYDSEQSDHLLLASLSTEITEGRISLADADPELDRLAASIFEIPVVDLDTAQDV